MEKINKQRIYNFYNKKNKWHGIIDYKTLFTFLIYVFILIKIVSIFNIDLLYKAYILITFILPVFIFTLVNINEECVVDKLVTIITYFLKRKIYVKYEYYAKLNKIYVKKVKK